MERDIDGHTGAIDMMQSSLIKRKPILSCSEKMGVLTWAKMVARDKAVFDGNKKYIKHSDLFSPEKNDTTLAGVRLYHF